MNILIINSQNAIYAAYDQTICFKAPYDSYETQEVALINAKATAFGYACTGCKVSCNTVVLDKNTNDDDIFSYLQSHN